MKKAGVVDNNDIYDMEAIFARLLAVGHQRHLDLSDVFQHEMSSVPPIIDEFGCLRKGDKSVLVRKCLGIPVENPPSPNEVYVDGSQLLYHIAWPVVGKGKVENVAAGMQERIKNVKGTKYVVFDRFQPLTAKVHERQRRAGEGATAYNLSLQTMLPGREAVLKNTSNKIKLCQLLCTFDIGGDVQMISKDDCIAWHDEADIILISYVLDAAKRRGEENTSSE